MVKKIIKKESIKTPTSAKNASVGVVAKNAITQNKSKMQKMHIASPGQLVNNTYRFKY